MSEFVDLNSLLEEKKDNPPAEVHENAPDAENEQPAKPEIKPIDFDSMEKFDPLAVLPVSNPTKDAQRDLMEKLDEGIQEAIERRFAPAVREVRAMQEEYYLRKESGEENPIVTSTYDASLELNPNLSDKDVEEIRKEQAKQREESTLEKHLSEDGYLGDEDSELPDQPLDEVEEEFNAIMSTEEKNVKVTPSTKSEVVKPNLETVDEEREVLSAPVTVSASTLETDDEDDELLEETNIIEDLEEFSDDLGLGDEIIEAERAKEDRRNKENFAEFASTLRVQMGLNKEKKDISRFKVRKRPEAAAKILNRSKKAKYFQWALFNTGVSISMSPLSAIELDEIMPQSQAINTIARATAVFKVIYKHLAPECREVPMETWLKTVSFRDLEHLYFAIYNANFSDGNIIPYSCPKCKHFFSEIRPIMDMVKFGDDKVKDHCLKIIGQDTSMPVGVEEEIFVANDQYAFGLVMPNIYNYAFEENFLDEKFREKYEGIINISHVISTIYYIDEENEELVPIKFAVAENDIIKTYKYKVLGVYKVLLELSAYDYKELQVQITKFVEENSKQTDVSYQLPASTCPKCGHSIEAEPLTATDLVFTRHQLIRMLES